MRKYILTIDGVCHDFESNSARDAYKKFLSGRDDKWKYVLNHYTKPMIIMKMIYADGLFAGMNRVGDIRCG